MKCFHAEHQNPNIRGGLEFAMEFVGEDEFIYKLFP